jgi:predicted HicB family RNase H-like nuclease
VTVEIDSACAIKSGVSRYTFRVQWCPDYDEYIGSCIELPFLSRRAPTAHEAVMAIDQAADQHVADMRAAGDEPPASLTERNYSGKIVVRTSPVLHARLVIEAIEQRVSMNQWIVQKLADRQLGSSLRPFGFD